MGISSGSNTTTPNGFPLPAFSEHILKIEKLGPNVSTKYLPSNLHSLVF